MKVHWYNECVDVGPGDTLSLNDFDQVSCETCIREAEKFRESETLGSCGCVDYHMADCPIRTGGSGMTSDDYMTMYSSPTYDPYYDDLP